MLHFSTKNTHNSIRDFPGKTDLSRNNTLSFEIVNLFQMIVPNKTVTTRNITLYSGNCTSTRVTRLDDTVFFRPTAANRFQRKEYFLPSSGE